MCSAALLQTAPREMGFDGAAHAVGDLAAAFGRVHVGVVTSYAYDGASRLETLAHDIGGTASDVTSTFAYNPAAQIVSNERSNRAYAFAPAPASVASTHNGLNQVATSGGQAASYDARGNLTAEAGRTFAYSSENMLTAMTGGGRDYDFFYDQLMRLREVATSNLATRSYVWDGNDAIVTYQVRAKLDVHRGRWRSSSGVGIRERHSAQREPEFVFGYLAPNRIWTQSMWDFGRFATAEASQACLAADLRVKIMACRNPTNAGFAFADYCSLHSVLCMPFQDVSIYRHMTQFLQSRRASRNVVLATESPLVDIGGSLDVAEIDFAQPGVLEATAVEDLWTAYLVVDPQNEWFWLPQHTDFGYFFGSPQDIERLVGEPLLTAYSLHSSSFRQPYSSSDWLDQEIRKLDLVWQRRLAEL